MLPRPAERGEGWGEGQSVAPLTRTRLRINFHALSPLTRGEGTCRAGALRGEACEPVELGLRQLAIVGDDHEMILHQAEHLDGKPQPLARIGVARRGVAPALDVIGLDLREDVFERLAAEQLLGARAARNCRLELVIDHLSLSASCAGRSASSRAFTPVHSPRRRAYTPFRPAMDARGRAYDPRIHREKVFANKMDRRVKPGGDDYLPGLLLRDGRHLGFLLHRLWSCRMGGVGDRLDGGTLHVLLVALARDLQVEQLELLLERELLAFEGELRVELHLLVRGIRRDLGLLGLRLRRDLSVLRV